MGVSGAAAVHDEHMAAALLASFGKSVRRDRRLIECSQRDLARQAKLSIKALGELERGQQTDAMFSTLVRLARALGRDLPEMLMEVRAEPTGSQ
jgi:transcriptional regulator with XRE-family HTH domain